MIEHHLDVIKRADWVIDPGPEAGRDGGRVVVQGPPEEVAAASEYRTGKWLQEVLTGGQPDGQTGGRAGAVSHRQALWALIAITVLWGISIPAVKGLYEYASPLVAVAVRFGVAALILSPMLRQVTREELRAGALIGTIFALGVVLQNKGLEITAASRQAFLLSMSALMTPAVAALTLKHRPEWAVVARLVVATAGVWLLTGGRADGQTRGLPELNLGDLLTLIAAVFYAGQIVAVGHFPRMLIGGASPAIHRAYSSSRRLTSAST